LIEKINQQLRETIPSKKIHATTKNPLIQEQQVLQIFQLDS